MRNATDHSLKKTAHCRIGQLSKAEGIHRAHRPRAHGKNIPDDATHASSRTLKRIHGAGMIVALDLERDSQSIANIKDASILFTRAHEYA